MSVLEQILPFWFPNGDKYEEFWFNGEKDREIFNIFYDFFKNFKGDLWSENPEITLSHIILFDQFSRNLSRIDESIDCKKYDKMILPIAERMLSENLDLEFSLSKRLFILLPLRHSAKSENNSTYLYKVLSRLKEYLKEYRIESSILKRFENATFSSFVGLTDQIIKVDGFHSEFNFDRYVDIIDPICKTYAYKSPNEIKNNYSILSNVAKQFTKNQRIGVSFSGGVDSTGLLFILAFLRDKGLISEVYAMHLEYCNRKESPLETEMLSEYCNKLGIVFYKRVIDFMSRDSVDREFYEKTTKDIRFATYRYLSELHQIDGWCLGHISDDVSENVMMNLCSGRDLLDLSVMTMQSEIEGVTIFRPFLNTKKSEIYEFAHLHYLSYLDDTTPDWSSRGVIRRKIVPAMEKQWPNVMDTLLAIGEQSRQWKGIVEKFVMEAIKRDFKRGFKRDKDIIIFEIKEEYKDLPLVIWTNIFLHIFHTMLGVKMISHKNIEYFMETLSNNIAKSNKFRFSNNCMGVFCKDYAEKITLCVYKIEKI
jgi:tRNA(Ile)-lysidine synthetase-like protein